MGRARTIARRTFLIGSAALVGGVAFGAYVVRKPHDNPLADTLAEGEATFNPWVKVTADGITLITPHPDIGQGAVQMQAILIAEEMDLDPGQFDLLRGASTLQTILVPAGPDRPACILGQQDFLHPAPSGFRSFRHFIRPQWAAHHL